MQDSGNQESAAHVALLPGAGMGHLMPFLRLATTLATHGVQVSFIAPHPTVSIAESQALSCLFASFPRISRKEFPLLPLDNTPPDSSEDPFYLHFKRIDFSSHLLSETLCSISPPLAALITDMSLASAVIPITKALGLPNFILFTSSARMLTLFASFHTLVGSEDIGGDGEMGEAANIPGLQPIPRSWIPPPLLSETSNLLKTMTTDNGKSLVQSKGILVNTFESFEQASLVALNNGRVVRGLPSVIPIGPLAPYHQRPQSLAWLDQQSAGSVIYVSFGSRTAMSRDQIRELGKGLVKSGCRFLWVVKDKKVDVEDKADLSEVIGHGIMEEAKENGLVVKHWVSQEAMLSHPAVGGFFSHCGWNSVTEAAWHGVPMLVWPQHGDQKMNAFVVETAGLGVWIKSWGWNGAEVLVREEEVGNSVREMMGNKSLRARAQQVREKARAAVEVDGSSGKGLVKLIEMWKNM